MSPGRSIPWAIYPLTQRMRVCLVPGPRVCLVPGQMVCLAPGQMVYLEVAPVCCSETPANHHSIATVTIGVVS
jgi:hypothetical protein